MFMLIALLVVFNFYDQYIFDREDVETPGALIEDVQPHRRLHFQGSFNFIYLVGVIATVVSSGRFGWPWGAREGVLIVISVLSWFTTSRKIHEANHFHFHPIIEVAAVFLGIFITMAPALEILNARAAAWKLTEPWQFFWITGALSGFLDNAPAYLAFAAVASGVVGGRVENLGMLLQTSTGEGLLRAISCGAVFMGALTYVGNGPNFMVKSIAQRGGIRMPSFAGYLVFSVTILIPLFIAVTLVFFR
jgi:Na+/H+ antiporter NhaD/arsenite permease-like protein